MTVPLTIPFDDVGRLPAPDDNVAIATRRLEAGTHITHNGDQVTLSHTVLVGHRFAVKPIDVGQSLLSWGQTFGIAIRPVAPGDYVCNDVVLTELHRRELDFELPAQPNFQNELEPYTFNEASFQPAQPLPRYTDVKTFMGYQRAGGRGVGTRNMIVLLGTTSLVSGFVNALEQQLRPLLADYPNIDQIVAVAHTEGGHGAANNRDLLLRTLSGFMVHPNVGAVLAVDYGHEVINNAALQGYIQANGYALDAVPHHFMSLSVAFEEDLNTAEQVVLRWMPQVNAAERTPQPLSELKIALQCGGSDAFSGVSGNPLAAWVAKEVIQYGGAANLAETDELIGAETYVLDKVRDSATVRKFLSFIARFKERVAWHGHSADGNPSGGNKYRGLYNIYLKSLGAATKRHPDVPLDAVIDYGEPMREGGFYFMDSPGNDLESIAGQVASGCNMIFFVTGNGSITNFPFVPTIKIITTTERYHLLPNEMDVNAGAYLDGTPLDELGAQTLQLTMNVASGQLSVGEAAGHAQVQIWRDWQQTHAIDLHPIKARHFDGTPLPVSVDVPVPDARIPVSLNQQGEMTTDQVGLVLPTSLCSGQIARMCVDQLNKHELGREEGLSQFVTLVHTEGCGGSVNLEFRDTLLGYLAHPFVKHALLLEHGCESTHNAFFRQAMQDRGYHPDDYGWASIQLDGGIQNVLHKIAGYFQTQLENDGPVQRAFAGLEAVRLALLTQGEVSPEAARAMAYLSQMIVAGGGTVLLHEQDSLLHSAFMEVFGLAEVQPTLDYGQVIEQAGLHIMAMPTRDWGEILTGMGAAGVEVMLAHVGVQPMPGHPMIPMLQVAAANSQNPSVDMSLDGDSKGDAQRMLDDIVRTLSHEYMPSVVRSGNVYFQITRGLLGVSL